MREPFIALLPLTHGVSFTHAHVLSAISDLFPALTSRLGLVEPGGFSADGDGHPCEIAIGPNRIRIEFFPGPPFLVHAASMQAQCPAWFGERTNHPRCHAHLVLTCRNDGADAHATLAAAAAVSMVAASLMAKVPVEEVIWTTGFVSTEPQSFLRMALRLTIPEVRVNQWLTWRIEAAQAPGARKADLIFVSKGLHPFFGRELETEPCALPAQELERRAVAVIEFLMLHGPPLVRDMPLHVPDLDGVRVRLAQSGQIEPGPVLKVIVDGADPRPSPLLGAMQQTHGLEGGRGFGKRGLA